jgi:hypothetical protein
MANTQAMCTSFKGDLLTGIHNFGTGVVRAATTADTFKAALYLASATIDASTTAYTATGEVSGTGYTQVVSPSHLALHRAPVARQRLSRQVPASPIPR